MELFLNKRNRTLAAAAGSGDTSIKVSPFDDLTSLSGGGTWSIRVDGELMMATGPSDGSGNVNVTRGTEGTTAVAHLVGASVFTPLTARAIAQLKSDVGSAGPGVDIDNAGTPLAGGPFTLLNLTSGLSATNSGGGEAAVSATGGGGGGANTVQAIQSGASTGSGNYALTAPPISVLGSGKFRIDVVCNAFSAQAGLDVLDWWIEADQGSGFSPLPALFGGTTGSPSNVMQSNMFANGNIGSFTYGDVDPSIVDPTTYSAGAGAVTYRFMFTTAGAVGSSLNWTVSNLKATIAVTEI
jgi:hypothetical protein